MSRRTRFLAGIFALVAMTSALTEGVLASACSPGMDMDDSAMSMGAESPHDGGMTDTGDRSEPQQSPDGGSDCPFAPVAAQGCLGMASIPANGIVAVAWSGDDRDRPAFDDQQQDLLLRSALFHPPRS